MVTFSGINFFTLDEVSEKSGYEKGTLYNMTTAKILSPPIRGLAGYPSQGLYKESVFDELQKYRELKLAGLKKREIIEHIITARAESNESLLQVLETRG